jgi:pilus assembly protein Flp/PilA
MMMEQMKKLMVEEEGQGMAEYGLILAGIAVVGAIAFGSLGKEIGSLIDKVTGDLKQ